MSQAQPSAFQLGDVVALRMSPSRHGAVIEVRPQSPQNQYTVLVDGRKESYYESQLERVADDSVAEPRPVSLDEFYARLSALELHEPGLDSLYSLQSGRIDFVPYQFRPVLKFIRAERPRLLIADEVGVGKTIETGLIIRELQARRELQTIMIVCSKALVAEHKWQQEMRRFDEEFVALDGPNLRYCITETDREGEWPRRFPRVIVPYSLFSEELLTGNHLEGRQQRPGLMSLEPPPRFDLLIVDEAHNARNPETNLYQGLKVLAENAEAVVFLTATPIQLGNKDLYTLLNLLRPDLILDRHTFEQMSAPNPDVNAAIAAVRGAIEGWEERAMSALQHAATSTAWGQSVLSKSPDFRAVVEALEHAPLSDEQRVRLIRQIEGLHSFAFVISRTRRRDIGAFTTRKPRTETVPFTPDQERLHNLLLQVQARILARVHGAWAVAFLMTTIRRQAASCIHGLAPYIHAILGRRVTDLAEAEVDPDYPTPGDDEVEAIRREIQSVVEEAQRLPAEDPKLDRLLSIIEEKNRLPNNKLLIFSSFRHTIGYLESRLAAAGKRIGVIHGDVDEEYRRDLRAAFARPKDDPTAVDILISSEVGSEGLDFQFCDGIVNYDIPWNPMRVEQRIGRIDRYGQRSEAVLIYNLVTPNTIDFAIYERCLMRIGVFERSIGGNEEILGDLSRQIRSVAEDLSLSADEQDARLRQIGDNEIRRIAEQESLEERQAELFGLTITSDVMQAELAAASSFWLSPDSLQRLLSVYLRQLIGNERSAFSGQGQVKTLRLPIEARRLLLPGRRRGRAPVSLVDRAWEKWLLGDRPTLAITFSQEAASDDQSAMLIGPTHPFIQHAARALTAEMGAIYTVLRTGPTRHDSGRYPFAIYHWLFHGMRPDSQLIPILEDESLTGDFVSLLSVATEAEIPASLALSKEVIERLERRHFNLWQERRSQHIADTIERARIRRESLATSHAARMSLLRDQLDNAKEDRIRRMRASQMAQAESEYRQSLAKVADAERAADITVRIIGFGILEVVGSNGDLV